MNPRLSRVGQGFLLVLLSMGVSQILPWNLLLLQLVWTTILRRITQEPMEDCKALVVVPPLNAEVLIAVPLSENSTKRCEFSQRRTRRLFSVSEVEALVEAVETLGAGRWRDVKMRAFNDANHRTYVDLKDKWKTLVHTASISPQQRRGQAVPRIV
ncbi:hypothetical protein L1987_62284 [Smallanthus sonchifolius]|uniref:Uncharacterized protein n=1 Tax=Smallanthus sonchifolius TaxID=185202 RepID=A0ACB9C9Y7_9ASTR|nr:hypothetical protein L1987_62284 [Smallanthus sonchifolius]